MMTSKLSVIAIARSIEHRRVMLYWIAPGASGAGGLREPGCANQVAQTMAPTMTKPLHGVIAAIATAVDEKGEPDCCALDRIGALPPR